MIKRVIQIREELGLSQEKFAEKIGLSRNFINQFENGKKNLSDRTILDICREFNVNETWLRTGEGEMFNTLTRSETLAKFAGELMKDEEDSFRRRLVELLSELNEDEWILLEKLAKKLAKK